MSDNPRQAADSPVFEITYLTDRVVAGKLDADDWDEPKTILLPRCAFNRFEPLEIGLKVSLILQAMPTLIAPKPKRSDSA